MLYVSTSYFYISSYSTSADIFDVNLVIVKMYHNRYLWCLSNANLDRINSDGHQHRCCPYPEGLLLPGLLEEGLHQWGRHLI